jgi:multidrug resistance protein MdtO
MYAKFTTWLDLWVDRYRQDLLPYPGRMSSTLRIVLAVIVTMVTLLILQMPFASLGLYIVFVVSRDSPALSLKSSIFSWIMIAISIGIELSVVILTDNDPMARVLSLAAVTFVAGVFMNATTVPALAAILGFAYGIVIAFWENHAPANALVNLSLRLLGTITVPLAVSVAVEYIFGDRNPALTLEAQRGERWRALEKMFTLYGQGAEQKERWDAYMRLARLAAAGQSGMQRLYNTIVERNLDTGNLQVGARVRITMLAQLMDEAAAFGAQNLSEVRPELRVRCERIAELCHEFAPDSKVPPREHGVSPKEHAQDLLDRVEGTLHAILAMPVSTGDPKDKQLVALPSKEVSILIPGALTSMDTIAFGLKISLCATICYIFYHAVDWPGISTAVTTVLITGLSTTGAIKQKLVFRLLGSTIGGLILGLGATAFLFPYLDSLTSFVVVVAIITFFAAWGATGPKFNYVGLQTAFSFYLVALEGSSAPTELAPARDRLIGIMVALVVMSFVFDQLWPVRTVTAMRRALATVLRSEAELFRMVQGTERQDDLLQHADMLRDRVGKTIAGLRTMNDSVNYEYGVDRELHKRLGDTILQAALTSVGMFWNQLAFLHREADRDFVTQPELVGMRQRMAGYLDAMANAVAEKKELTTAPVTTFVDSALLDNPRYGEYTRNTVARYEELQATVHSLGVEV